MGGYLDALVRDGRVFAVGQSLVATGVSGAQFVLWLPAVPDRTLRVVSFDLAASVQMTATVALLEANPALAAGNVPGNLNPPGPKTIASFQAAVAAAPTAAETIASTLLAPGTAPHLLCHVRPRIRPNRGILFSSAAVAGTVYLSLIFAEISPAWEAEQFGD